MDDEDRDAIVKRRNRFITLAFVGLATSCGGAKPAEATTPPHDEPLGDVHPQVCLSIEAPPEADAGVPPDPGPQVCLSEMIIEGET